MPRIFYSRRYNIGFCGLERLHPFDSRKYGRAWRLIQRHFGARLRSLHVRPRRAASREELLLVHTPEYLSELRDPKYLARALEVPLLARLPGWAIDWRVLSAMRWATHGTQLAAREALACGFAVNLSGGYHHAKPDRGEGFSIYSDIGIAIADLRHNELIAETDRIAYIDADAHQGNGVCHTFMDDSRVFIFDIFNGHIYPLFDVDARGRVDCPLPITDATTDEQYMQTLTSRLPGFIDSVANANTRLAIYNAGTDVVAGDPVGSLNISSETVLERDLFIVGELRKRQIPTVMVLSGGYTPQSYKLVATSVIELLARELSA